MLLYWIWLATRHGINEREKYLLVQHFHDPEDLYFAQADALKELGLRKEGLDALRDKDLAPAQKILDSCVNKDIRVCTFRDPDYPAKLKNIPDPPIVLYYKGNLSAMEDVPVVAVVGTRKSTPYGVKIARNMAYQLSGCGITVVSGLAEGIDGAGAAGAIMAGGPVIGVLGCGADRVYPSFNRSLYEQTQRLGCLVTEYPPGTPPYKWNFPKRNRIISGLSNGVLVVEAPKGSGSLITARDALEQGRDVFCVPGNLDMPTFFGSNALLREGATMATCSWDVAGEYEALYPGKVCPFEETDPSIVSATLEEIMPKVAQKAKTPAKNHSTDRKKEKKPVDKPSAPSYSDIHDSLSADERRITEVLRQGPCLADDVIARTGMSAAQLSSLLTMLQIKGIITKKPGNILALK